MEIKTISKSLILGVRIDTLRFKEALAWVASIINGPSATMQYIVTPNPEILVDAARNDSFRAALNGSSLSIADGTGTFIVGLLLGIRIPSRITGIDFAEALFASYAERPLQVFLVGGEEGVAARAAKFLEKRYSIHRFIPASFSPFIRPDGVFVYDYEQKRIITEAIHSNADIVLVGFGAPKQELWMSTYASILTGIRLAIGVGGALDVWAGKKIRAPKPLRALGLEWLWRLTLEPQRFGRIFKAVIIFPLLAILLRKKQ